MDILNRAEQVFQSEMQAIDATRRQLDRNFEEAVEKIASCAGRLIIAGIGKSGIIGRKIAATFSSTGTPAFFLHPAEAVHGDLGVINRNDIVMVISNSGQTEEVLRIMPRIRKIGAFLVAITGNRRSQLTSYADINLNMAGGPEADQFELVPSSSTAALLVLGDALAICVLEKKGFRKKDYAFLHPAGELGRRLTMKVEDVMYSSTEIPLVSRGASLSATIKVLNKYNLGLVVVTDGEDKLAGVATDGDLRRFLLQKKTIVASRVDDIMTANPKLISADDLTAAAVAEMEKHEITSLVVVDRRRRPVGLVHLHAVLGGKKLYGGK